MAFAPPAGLGESHKSSLSVSGGPVAERRGLSRRLGRYGDCNLLRDGLPAAFGE